MLGGERKDLFKRVGKGQLFYLFGGKAKNPGIENVHRVNKALGIEEEKTPPDETLSEGEKMLLDLFNRVPEEKQELLLQLIRTALEMQ